MTGQIPDDGSKRVKNIAAVIYLLVMMFIVGGSYLHQQQANDNPPLSTQTMTK